MRHTLTDVFNKMRYVFIALLFLNNIACSTAKDPKQETSPAVQNETVTVPVTQRGFPKTELASEELAWAQQTLDLLGYHPGNVNGQLTPQTHSALTQFQKQSGLSASGTLDPSTVQALAQAEHSLSQQPEKPQRDTVRMRPPLTTDNQTKPIVPVTPNPPATLSLTNIQAVGVHQVAAYLAEAGYFREPLKQATLETVETALKAFQRDIGVKQWKFLDGTTWDKLQSITLSQSRQAELEAAIAFSKKSKKSRFNTPATEPSATVIARPTIKYSDPTLAETPAPVVMPRHSSAEPTVPVTQPKPRDPAMPTFALNLGDSVYAIDQIECKSNHEAFALFYQGQLQHIQNELVQVQVNERYAMWYDVNQEGVSDENWWCIPKKRFCYSRINFTDWRGKLKQRDVGHFQTHTTMPNRFDITALVAKFAKKTCSF